MKDSVNTGDSVQRADWDGIAHPSLAPCARNPLLVPMMRSVTDSRRIYSVHMEKTPGRTPARCGSRIIEPCPTSTGRPAETIDAYLELKDISFTASRTSSSARAVSTFILNVSRQRTSRASSRRSSAYTPYQT